MASRLEAFSRLFTPAEQTFHLMPSVKFGPVLPDGRQQRVQSSGPHWVATTRYDLALSEEWIEFRSFVTKMAGGVTEIIMPVHDRRQAPWPTGYDWASDQIDVSWDSSRTWDTPFKRQIIQIRAASSALAGATELEIKIMTAGDLKRGHYFSITDRTGRPRLYQIASVPAPVPGDTTKTISFQPPLRAFVADKSGLDFDNPKCTMTLDKPDSGMLTIEAWGTAKPTLTLREAFGGLQ